VSIDGKGSALSRRAEDRISALVSSNTRLTGEKTALIERVAVLENLVQSVSDDREGYLARCVELEQLISRIDGTLTGLRLKYEARDREEFTGESVSALDAVTECIEAFQRVTAAEAAKESVA
jgi:hypothetical protein